jgi:hypothetical protein
MPFFIALAQLITTCYRLGKYTLIRSVEEDHGGLEGDEDECTHNRDPVTVGSTITLDNVQPAAPKTSHERIAAIV